MPVGTGSGSRSYTVRAGSSGTSSSSCEDKRALVKYRLRAMLTSREKIGAPIRIERRFRAGRYHHIGKLTPYARNAILARGRYGHWACPHTRALVANVLHLVVR